MQNWKTSISESCLAAARYQQQIGNTDIAIKYFRKASEIVITRDPIKAATLNDQLQAFKAPLTQQLANLTMSADIRESVKNIKCYSKSSRFDITFSDEETTQACLKKFIKHKLKCNLLQNSTTALAITIDLDLDASTYQRALDACHQAIINQRNAKLQEAFKEKRAHETIPVRIFSASDRAENSSLKHPKADKRKKNSAIKNPKEEAKSKWQFFVQKQEPLTKVIFEKSQKTFDPEIRNGVVTIPFHGNTGIWFACLNPRIVEELDKLKPGEGQKLAQLFLTQQELSQKCTIPCFKEMSIKSKKHQIDGRYIFKIRLHGKDIGNIRIYGEVIDECNNQKLIAFTAINPNSHEKHTVPIHYPMLTEDLTADIKCK